jgi:hypothetical protein
MDPDSSPLRRGSVSNWHCTLCVFIEVYQSNKLRDVNIATNPSALRHFCSIFSKIAVLIRYKLSTARRINCAVAALHVLSLTNSFPSNKHTQDVLRQRVAYFDMDMSYTRVLHPKVAHSHSQSHSHSQMTSRVLRHTAAAMRAHNVLQGTVEKLRWTVATFLVYVLCCCT